MEGLISAFGTSPWGPMALGFLFGIAFGWALWGASDSSRAESKRSASAGDHKEIVVIKAELEAARSLLDEGDDQQEAIAQQLSTLDETVKRANGRLKALLAAVKRAANRD